jgi:hypothetical protein
MLLLGWTYFLWVALVGLFAFHVPGPYLWTAGAIALLCSGFLMTRSRLQAFYVLPIVCLAGPILTVQIPNLGAVTVADLYLFLFAIVALFFVGRGEIRFGRYSREYGAMAFLIVLGWWQSRYSAETLPGLINIAELVLVYLLTATLVCKPQNMRAFFRSWIVASTICCGLTVLRYYQSEPLLLGMGDYGPGYAESVKESSEGFYRATFFYAGFFFIIAMVVIFCLFELLSARAKSVGWRRLLFGALVVNVITLFLMNNKTALAALVLAATVIFAKRFGILGKVRNANSGWSVASLALLLVLAYSVYAGIQRLVPQNQLQAAWGRAQDSGDLTARWAIYRNALAFGVDHPRWLLLGLGPDAFTRVLNEPQIGVILQNPLTGTYEGAVDSSYVASLLEYGVFVCLLFWMVGFRTLKQLWKMWRTGKERVALTLCVAIGTWMLMGITQLTGTSKTTWLLVELLALAHVLLPVKPQATAAATPHA